MLRPTTWAQVESWHGPHTFDLMALDSNVMVKQDGTPLPHFSPTPLPGSAGVNIFAQHLNSQENYYVFPTFSLISPLLRFLFQEVGRPLRCTIIVPKLMPLPPWWSLLMSLASSMQCLAVTGDLNAVLVPSKQGFIPSRTGLPYDLFVARLEFK